ncbi:hypothetical protein [Pyrofollis japonicus]|uniref:hypothetical protein n=1 Tax=Pyrofollis japonicus TaxID=3060460 RepID=UPI00295BBD89|nr:hypothetical protein [Pyrofollis japonicus]
MARDITHAKQVFFNIILLVSIAALVAVSAAVHLGSLQCGRSCNRVLAVSVILLLVSAALYAFAVGFAVFGLARLIVRYLLYGAGIINVVAVLAGLLVAKDAVSLLVLLSSLVIAIAIILGLTKSP